MKLAIVTIICIISLVWLSTIIVIRAHENARWAEEQMQSAIDECEATLPRNQQCIPIFTAQPVITDYLI